MAPEIVGLDKPLDLSDLRKQYHSFITRLEQETIPRNNNPSVHELYTQTAPQRNLEERLSLIKPPTSTNNTYNLQLHKPIYQLNNQSTATHTKNPPYNTPTFYQQAA